MLHLDRKNAESLIIVLPDGRVIRQTILSLQGHKVRIGTDAPMDVQVHREEVWERIQAEKNAA